MLERLLESRRGPRPDMTPRLARFKGVRTPGSEPMVSVEGLPGIEYVSGKVSRLFVELLKDPGIQELWQGNRSALAGVNIPAIVPEYLLAIANPLHKFPFRLNPTVFPFPDVLNKFQAARTNRRLQIQEDAPEKVNAFTSLWQSPMTIMNEAYVFEVNSGVLPYGMFPNPDRRMYEAELREAGVVSGKSFGIRLVNGLEDAVDHEWELSVRLSSGGWVHDLLRAGFREVGGQLEFVSFINEGHADEHDSGLFVL